MRFYTTILYFLLSWNVFLFSQVTITGSTLLENQNYATLNTALTALDGTGTTSQNGKNITITISSAISATASVTLNHKGWNSLVIEGNGNTVSQSTYNITFTGVENVSLSNLTLGSTNGLGSMILINGTSKNVNITNCTLLLGIESGIQISGSSANTTIQNCIFTKSSSYRTTGNYRAIYIDTAVTNTLIKNNEFRNLLRSDYITNVIHATNVNLKTLILDGNSFYETQPIELPSGWSRYIYVGGGSGGGVEVEDLRIKNNYFGSTAAKGEGEILNLGTTAVSRNFICVETSTRGQSTHYTSTNSDSIIANHFAKISMTSTATTAPNSGEEKRGALTAYFNWYAGWPKIIGNTINDFTLTGSGTDNVYLVGFGHTGSEPTFENNTIKNLTTYHDNPARSASISAICLGAINVTGASSSTAKQVTFKNNLIDGLYANSAAASQAQHVIGVRFTDYGLPYEGPSAYIDNKIYNLTNSGNSSTAPHFVAGFYSEVGLATFRKVYVGNEFANFKLTGSSSGKSAAIYFMMAKSAYIENNLIRDMSMGTATTGSLYGILASELGFSVDTIKNNKIYNLTGPVSSEANTDAVIGITTASVGSYNFEIANNFISNLKLNNGGNGRVIGIQYTKAGIGVIYNNIISLCNTNLTYGINLTGGKTFSYHNTVLVNSTNENSCVFRGMNPTASIIKNNIFDSRGKGYGLYTNAMPSASYNNLYAVDPDKAYSYNGGTSAMTSSFTIKPVYVVDDMFCSVDSIKGMQLAYTPVTFYGATDTGIKTDVAGTARSTTTPVLGAWESFGEIAELFVDSTMVESGSGLKWETALKTVAEALNIANSAISIKNVYVAKGTYYPTTIPVIDNASSIGTTNRDKTFEIRTDIKMYGSYPNKSTGTQTDFGLRDFNTFKTILSGDLSKNDIQGNLVSNKDDNAYHVLLINTATPQHNAELLIDGFTISGGYSLNGGGIQLMIADGAHSGTSGVFTRNYGAGIASYKSPYSLENIVLKDNVAAQGGAISNQGVSTLDFSELNYNNIIFKNNYADNAPAIYNHFTILNVRNFTVAENTAVSTGSSIIQIKGSPSMFSHGIIAGNSLIKASNVLYIHKDETGVTDQSELKNILINGNTGSYAIKLSGAPMIITNSTIAGNTGYGLYSSDANVVVRNSIIYGNTTNSGSENNGQINTTHSLTDGSVNPQFINMVPATNNIPTTYGNYHLLQNSPAIYSGNTSFAAGINEDLDGNPRVVNSYIDMGVYQQSNKYWYGDTSSDWDVADNWIPKVIPADGDSVYFSPSAKNNLHVNQATNRTQSSIFENSSGKSLVVTPNAYLKISETLHGFNAYNFLIQGENGADGSVNGTFIFPQGKEQNATVGFYSKSVTDEEITSSKQYTWQYITSPVKAFQAQYLQGFWARLYDETAPEGKHWIQLQNPDMLYPFKGYEVSRKQSSNPTGTIHFQGKLINNDTTINVSYTPDNALYHGMLVTGNPYTAALGIQQGLRFNSGMEETVYLYNTGSSEEWSNGGSTSGTQPGQYLAVPQILAGEGGLPSTIPSMQGFVVKTDDGNTASGSFSFLYSGVEKNKTSMRSKGVGEINQRIYTTVELSDEKGEKDKMWIFVDENSTRNFDNGYDGKKLGSKSAATQLFAKEKDGDYQVNMIPEINNTLLCVKTNKRAADYKLTIKHKGTNQDGELYLLDLTTGSLTDITADSTEYRFRVFESSKPERRFQIITQKPEIKDTEENDIASISNIDGNILIQNNTKEILQVQAYDIQGRQIRQFQIDPVKISVMSSLPAGVYIIDIRNSTERQSKKIMIN